MSESRLAKWVAVIVAVAALLGIAYGSTDTAADASNVDEELGFLPRADGLAPVTDVAEVTVPVVEPAPVIEAPPIDTTAGLLEARWGRNVALTISQDEFRFASNGIPNHELPNPFLATEAPGISASPNRATFDGSGIVVPVAESPIDRTITVNPQLADEPSLPPGGLIGVLINGAQLFYDFDPFSAREAGSLEFGFVDVCNGHLTDPGVDGSAAGSYHYHAVPSCTTDAIDIEGQHSSILGVLIDGFPVYGSNDVGGAAVTAADLDSCNGHFGSTPEFPDGIYHYHLLDEIREDPIPCLSGVVADVAALADVEVLSETEIPVEAEIFDDRDSDDAPKDDDEGTDGAEPADDFEFDGRSLSVE